MRPPWLVFAVVGALAALGCSTSVAEAGHDAGDAKARDDDEAGVVHDGATRDASDAVKTPDGHGHDAVLDVALDHAAAPPETGDARDVDAEPEGGDARAASDGGDATVDDAGSACSDGTPVAYTRTSCPGSPPPVPSGLSAAAASASVGDVVSLDGLDDSSLPCFPVRICVAPAAPTLVFSDDPESPSSDGVLYADELAAGAYRAYVYHTNAGSGLRSFPVVLLNEGSTTVHATVTAKGVAGPSQDYVDVGKQAVLRWLASQGMGTIATVDVPPGERVLLDEDLADVQAGTNDLAHAILDFTLDGPVKLSVVSVVSGEDATMVTGGLSLLAQDGMHQRGTFPGADLEIEPMTPVDGSGARHLRLGGDVTDASLVGHDYVDDTTVTLDGNYGVAYAVDVPFAASSPTAVLLSPQGGAWGGAVGVSGADTLLPTSEDSLASQTDAIVVGSYGGGESATFVFLSAGGSSLPVDLVTAPLP